MKHINEKLLTVNELVERFVAIAIEQDKAIFSEETTKYNRLFDQMKAIVQELKKRSGDQRLALMPLYAHPNVHVRLKAAIYTLDIARADAREVLESIADSPQYPDEAADARLTLWRLDGTSPVKA